MPKKEMQQQLIEQFSISVGKYIKHTACFFNIKNKCIRHYKTHISLLFFFFFQRGKFWLVPSKVQVLRPGGQFAIFGFWVAILTTQARPPLTSAKYIKQCPDSPNYPEPRIVILAKRVCGQPGGGGLQLKKKTAYLKLWHGACQLYVVQLTKHFSHFFGENQQKKL